MPTNTNFKLIYQASRDGFDSNAFHSKCDGIYGTLTLIRTTDSYIIGGYTSADWSGYQYKHDSSAFLFSLSNPFNVSFRSNISQAQYAINANQYYGPSFGYDLLIMDQSNTSISNFINFQSYYYQIPNDFQTIKNQLIYLNFQTVEIEVYSLDRKY